MTDPVAISLIGAAASVVTVVLGFVNNILARRNAQSARDTHASISALASNTNGMTEQIKQAEYAKGLLQGKIEHSAQAHDANDAQATTCRFPG